jgi:integrase
LTLDEQKRLFETAALWKLDAPLSKRGKDGKTYKLQANWQYTHAAATLAAYCGLRACEIKGLQWKDVELREWIAANTALKDPRRMANTNAQRRMF